MNQDEEFAEGCGVRICGRLKSAARWQHGRSTHVHVRARPRMPLFYCDLRDNAIPNCKLWTCVRALAEEWLLKRLAISTPAIIDNNIESAAHSALQQIIGVSAAETNETNERRWPLTRTPRYLTRVRASMRPHYLSSGHLLGAPLPPATHDKYVKIHGKSEDYSPNACGTTLVPRDVYSFIKHVLNPYLINAVNSYRLMYVVGPTSRMFFGF